MATGLDQAVFWPVMGALPKEEEERIVRAGVNGYDGRHRAVTEAIGLVKKYAAEEALAKALDDPAYAAKAVQSETFRAAVLSHPVLGKQLLARHRGDREEPDLLPGSGPGRGGERENDVMNDSLRDLWRGAEDRGDTERAAGAGAANGRAAHRDLLDDD